MMGIVEPFPKIRKGLSQKSLLETAPSCRLILHAQFNVTEKEDRRTVPWWIQRTYCPLEVENRLVRKFQRTYSPLQRSGCLNQKILRVWRLADGLYVRYFLKNRLQSLVTDSMSVNRRQPSFMQRTSFQKKIRRIPGSDAGQPNFQPDVCQWMPSDEANRTIWPLRSSTQVITNDAPFFVHSSTR